MMQDDKELKRTPLFNFHKELGAKFVPFGGWEMPVQYSGLVDEHNTVRNSVGLFDVSHMGEIVVRGSSALDYLEKITCNKVSTLKPGFAQYSMFLNESGGVVDDVIIYRRAKDYLICVNASNTEKDYNWMLDHLSSNVEVENLSSEFAQIAIQGPNAQELLERAFCFDIGSHDQNSAPAFSFVEVDCKNIENGCECTIARTGYTGEDGFEIFCPPDKAEKLGYLLLELGQSLGLKPAGLGARDTLRLEACYPLHGHELSDEISPLEAGLSWVVKLDKGEFIGRDALEGQKRDGLRRKLIGIEVLDRGIVREEANIYVGQKHVGVTTSGTRPPTVDKAIALGLVDIDYSKIGQELEVEVRSRRLKVKIIKRPFYKRK